VSFYLVLWRLFDVNGMSKVTHPFRFKLDVPRNEKAAVAAIVSPPLTEKTFFCNFVNFPRPAWSDIYDYGKPEWST
jgi:hypothetical protein